nr:MAG TPA: hypothetical protein [Caudoviricetes sp.]
MFLYPVSPGTVNSLYPMLQGSFQQQFKRHKPFSDKRKDTLADALKYYLTHSWEIIRITIPFYNTK